MSRAENSDQAQKRWPRFASAFGHWCEGSTDRVAAQTLISYSVNLRWFHLRVLWAKKFISNNFSCFPAEIKNTNKLPPCLNSQRHYVSYRSLTRWRVAVYDLWRILFYCYVVFTDERTCFCLLRALCKSFPFLSCAFYPQPPPPPSRKPDYASAFTPKKKF